MPGRKRRRTFSHLSEFETGAIIGLREGGLSCRKIAVLLGRSSATISRACQQLTKQGFLHLEESNSSNANVRKRKQASAPHNGAMENNISGDVYKFCSPPIRVTRSRSASSQMSPSIASASSLDPSA